MAKARYLIIEEIPCAKCNRSGFIPNPAWEEFWKSHRSFEVTKEIARHWFKESGSLRNMTTRIDGLPDKEIICPECEGNGNLISQVELEEAMKELGFINAMPVNFTPAENQ